MTATKLLELSRVEPTGMVVDIHLQGIGRMSIEVIQLAQEKWEYDSRAALGEPGGFGEVFKGKGAIGDVAVKRLKLTAQEAAHRELSIGKYLSERSYENVVPIFDSGQDANSERYFLVMPVCEYSLQKKLYEGPILYEDSVSIIRSIINGLLEVGDLVHRDLKPSNVMFHSGTWKIADFGIAKFVEDSTSLETLRTSLTPAYAAPEQWRGERPGHAADVYALGCIIYALINGSPPFVGDNDTLRQKHLHDVPPSLTGVPPRLAALVSHMLRKTEDVRPTIERCKRVLETTLEAGHGGSIGRSALHLAAQEIAQAHAATEAKLAEELSRRKRHEALFHEARRELAGINSRLTDEITDGAETARVDGNVIVFGSALLRTPQAIEIPYDGAPEVTYPHSGWNAVAWSIIGISIYDPMSLRTTYEWSSSLIYADRADGEGYRWYEVSFFSSTGSGAESSPHALPGDRDDIDIAISNIWHTESVAFGPTPIDAEDEEAFRSRWLYLVARGARAALRAPDQFPITTEFFQG